MSPVTRVLYVGGSGRSGSTMIANVLGEVPGAVSVGEVRFLWERGILQDRLCGCGEPFAGCAFWGEVLERALGRTATGADRELLARRMQAGLRERTRMRSLPRALAGRGPDATGDEVGPTLERLYAAIADVAGARVVVDSSKLPTYAALLHAVPGIDLHVLQVVRDPRAAAHSWRRRKAQPDLGPGAQMERRGAAKSAALWRIWNGALEWWCREREVDHRLQNYESFVADPIGETRRILRRFELVPAARVEAVVADIFADRDVVRLHANHTVAGNPSRHQHGLVPLVPDEEWHTHLEPRDRRAVEVVTWPALRHYGYRARA